MLPGEPARHGIPGGRRHPHHAEHRPGRERDPVVHVDRVAVDPEDPGDRVRHLCLKLADSGDRQCHAGLRGTDLQDLDNQRVARLGAANGHRPGGAVDAVEIEIRVDVADEVLLARDLAAEAVLHLEADDGAGLDLDDRGHVRPEGEDNLLVRERVLGVGDCHPSRPPVWPAPGSYRPAVRGS